MCPVTKEKDVLTSDEKEVCGMHLCASRTSLRETSLAPYSGDVQRHSVLKLDGFHCSGETSLSACLCCLILPLRHMLLVTIRDKRLNYMDPSCNLGQML